MTARSQPDLCLPSKCRYKQCKVNSTEIFINSAQKSAGECAGGNQSHVCSKHSCEHTSDVINNEVTAFATLQCCSFCREQLLGSPLVSWACLRGRFGLTTKGLHFSMAADSAERTNQTWRACAQQPGRAGLDYQKPGANIWNLSPYMVPQYVFVTFLSCISSPRWNCSFSSFCSILWKAVQRRNCWIWNSSPQFQIFS